MTAPWNREGDCRTCHSPVFLVSIVSGAGDGDSWWSGAVGWSGLVEVCGQLADGTGGIAPELGVSPGLLRCWLA
jgi:hypothetical protein